MRKLPRLLVAALLVALLLAAIGYYVTSDGPPPAVGDLRLERPDIPEKQNAYYWFNRAGEKVYWPEDEESEDRLLEMLDGDTWEAPQVEELLERNREALELLNRGLRCSRCQAPEPKGIGETCPLLLPWLHLGRVVCLRAVSLLEKGEEQRALRELMTVLHFGNMIEACKGELILYYLGIEAKATAFRHLIGSPWGSPSEPALLIRNARRLGDYRADQRGLCDAFRAEYRNAEILVDDLAQGKCSFDDVLGGDDPSFPAGYTGYFFQPNNTKRLFGQMYRTYIGNVPRTAAEFDFSGLPDLPRDDPNLVLLAASGNLFGKILASVLQPNGEGLLLKKCWENLHVGAAQLVLSLRAFEQREGHLPESLDALVPDYLDAVPVDPFDGRPMRYSRDRRIVYSVGEDLEDSGGSKGENLREMADPTFHVGPKPPLTTRP